MSISMLRKRRKDNILSKIAITFIITVVNIIIVVVVLVNLESAKANGRDRLVVV